MTFERYCMREIPSVSIPSAVTRSALLAVLQSIYRSLPLRDRRVLLGGTLIAAGLIVLAKAR
jgi:hypothetical protein